jgi:hypothetical protein
MIKGRHTISDSPGDVLDCACTVEVSVDSETVELQFPQLTREHYYIGPIVYVCMNGTELTVRLTDSDDVVWGFAWDEGGGRWLQRDTPNAPAGAYRRKPPICSGGMLADRRTHEKAD